MTRIIHQTEILDALGDIDLVAAMEQAFSAYSSGRAVVPPVGELLFDSPPGEVHIKYGYINGEKYYVIKVASGFYENRALGLPTNNGLVLLFKQASGELEAIFLDQGCLTEQRTAAAGAVAAKHLAPSRVDFIGIVGTGTQAEMQLRHLSDVCACRDVLVWGRNDASVQKFCKRLADTPFTVRPVVDVEELVDKSRLIVTATAAHSPLLSTVRSGTHITAMGSDTTEKQELHPDILICADLVVSDAIAQAKTRGEIFQACSHSEFLIDSVIELGSITSGNHPGRSNDEQVTVADLTGVATQDIAIASAVYKALFTAN